MISKTELNNAQCVKHNGPGAGQQVSHSYRPNGTHRKLWYYHPSVANTVFPQFVAHEFELFCKRNGIKHIRVTSHGLAEREGIAR